MRDTIIALLLSLVLYTQATVYYVDPVNGNDSNDGKSTDQAWGTLGGLKFAGLSPGDIVYARGGSYVDAHIHSGTFLTPTWDVPITLAAYPGETPIITGKAIDGTYFNLFDVNWIIDGFRFESDVLPSEQGYWIYFSNAHNSTIRNCYFGHNWAISTTVVNSNYVTIENNTFTHSGIFDQEGAAHVTVQGSTHCLIQNNVFGTARHYDIDIVEYNGKYSAYTVVRNNVFENHWGGGVAPIRRTTWTLIEDNVFRYMGSDIDYPKAAVNLNSMYNIVRRNVLENTGPANESDPYTADVCLTLYSFLYSGTYQHCKHNRVYNNLLYRCGSAAVAITQKDDSEAEDNYLVNNIMYQSAWSGDVFQYLPNGNYSILFNTYWSNPEHRWPDAEFATNRVNITNNLILNTDRAGNPIFQNPTAASWVQTTTYTWSIEELEEDFPLIFSNNVAFEPGFVDLENKNYNLRADSQSIDAGIPLTKAVGSGDNTDTIVVQDALFFFSGWDFQDRGLEADMLQIGSNSPVRIASIDYETNTITLESSISYQDGDAVSLPYEGSAPDLGPTEYVPAAVPVAPPGSSTGPSTDSPVKAPKAAISGASALVPLFSVAAWIALSI